MRILAAVALVIAGFVTFAFIRGGPGIVDRLHDDGFPISHWNGLSVGAVGWVGDTADQREDPTETIETSIAEAFDLWGFAPPSVVDTPVEAAIATLSGSESAANPVDVFPIEWRGKEVAPLLLVVTETPDPIVHYTGGSIVSLVPEVGSLFGLRGWDDDTGPTVVIVPIVEFRYLLLHSLGRWIAYLWCEQHRISARRLPDLLLGGIGDYTASAYLPWLEWREKAPLCAAQQDLTLDPQGEEIDRRAVGASLVAYLVEAESVEGFLDSLAGWARDADGMLEQRRDGWKAYLESL